jgi:hypothetical protein
LFITDWSNDISNPHRKINECDYVTVKLAIDYFIDNPEIDFVCDYKSIKK